MSLGDMKTAMNTKKHKNIQLRNSTQLRNRASSCFKNCQSMDSQISSDMAKFNFI